MTALKGPKDQQVSQAYRVIPELQVYRVFKASQVSQVTRVSQVFREWQA